MRYCAGGIVRLVVWPSGQCVIVVSNVGINLIIKYIAESINIGLFCPLIRLVSFIIFIGRFNS